MPVPPRPRSNQAWLAVSASPASWCARSSCWAWAGRWPSLSPKACAGGCGTAELDSASPPQNVRIVHGWAAETEISLPTGA